MKTYNFFHLPLLLLLLVLTPTSVIAEALKAEVHRGIQGHSKLPNGWLPVRLLFSYNSKSYTALIAVDEEKFNRYSQQTRLRGDPRRSRGHAVAALELSNEGKKDVLPLAKALYKVAPDKSREGLAAFILAFVQSLPYEQDALTSIGDEIWRSPLQTLVDPGIDCEDSSILYASLMSAVKQDSALVIVPGHMLVALPGRYKGKSFNYRNKDYYFAETTSKGWDIGNLPPQVRTENLLVFSVNAYQSGKRKAKKINKSVSSKQRPKSDRTSSKSDSTGGIFYFMILMLFTGLGAWFAWDNGWFSSTDNDEIEDDDTKEFFDDHEDSWK